MEQTARAAKNAYQKEWRKKNPEKVRAANERYWIKKAAEMEATQKEAKHDVDKYND